MTRKPIKFELFFVLAVAVVCLAMSANGSAQAAEPHAQQPAKPAPAHSEAAKPAEHSEEAKEGEKAASEHAAASEGEKGEEKDEHAQFTESPSVKAFGRMLGLETKQAYWASVIFNFLVLVFLGWLFSKSKVPQMFRDRSAAIQRGVEEAKKASAESAARLTEIESRLSKLDDEIASMRAQAEEDAHAEEERLRASTEEEKRKIVQSAEQEIAAASTNARRELKNLAAELAVSLAEKRLSVSENADRILIKDFASNLSSSTDGKGGR
jgi:F-type H+-transporting ATPase subunit b